MDTAGDGSPIGRLANARLLWEDGARNLPPRRLAQLRKLGVQLNPTALPMREILELTDVDFAQELANLGYPGLVHHQNGDATWNPAQLLVLALAQNQLNRRVAEALPWLVFRYWEMNWEWVVRESKLRDLQNRLGFTLLLAQELAFQEKCPEIVDRLSRLGQELHRSLLAKDDTYCNEQMTESERRWLREHRPEQARTWNVLSDLRLEHLTMLPKVDSLPEPWASFLGELDQIATEPVDFHCIGGFVVTRRYGFARETRDLDVLSITPNTQREAFLQRGAEGSDLHRKYKIYLDLVTVLEAYPENYEERLTEIFSGQLKHIRLLAPEAHDLALMKLGRNIERDRDDVKYLARQGFLIPEELERRYQNEMRPYLALPEQRNDWVMKLWIEMLHEELSADFPGSTED